MEKECEMLVELVAYTKGEYSETPVEIVGKAGGICYDKEDKESYDTFIKGIVRRGHDSVIEHVSFVFRIEGVSRALTHQLVRHRIASYSQRSQRYCKEDGFRYIIPPNIANDKTKRQAFMSFMTLIEQNYQSLIEDGIKPQDARFILPNACETRIVVTMNARSLRNFFDLRMDSHAQWEIREMACRMFDLAVEKAPALFDDLQELRDKNKKPE